MTVIHPLKFRWDGAAMIPLVESVAARQYALGATYRLAPWEDRAPAAHNHYFAAIHEGWRNLPERFVGRWPTAEHLRRDLLIQVGYRDERSIVCASKAEAVRLAGFIAPMDRYAVIEARNAVVTVYTAKSQSMRAMGKQEFADSKREVLELLSEIIGVSQDDLEADARISA